MTAGSRGGGVPVLLRAGVTTPFWSPMLGHGEKWSVTLTEKGEYNYFCTPHPYMEGIIRVE